MDCIGRQMEEERFACVVLFPVDDKVDRMLQVKIVNRIALHFRIAHRIVPTGLRIDKIEAWHERLGTRQLEVTIQAGETKNINLSFHRLVDCSQR